MLRTTMRGSWRCTMAAAMVLACGGMWVAPAAVLSVSEARASAMCPPSEGELDLEGYDLSGDGIVQLPEGVRWRVMPAKAAAALDEEGGCGSKTRAAGVTLVLEDPSRDNRRVMTMKLTTLAATEVQEWLGDAVGDQQEWLTAKSYAEKPGMECALDVQHCRAAAKTEAGGCPHAAATVAVKKVEMPRMYVSVASANGQHGWSLLPASQTLTVKTETEGCRKTCSGDGASKAKAADKNVVAADHRITLTAYQMRDQANRPLSVRMDVATAKKLASDLKDALAGKEPKVAEPAVEKPVQEASKGVS